MATCFWLSHQFEVHEHTANWNEVPGVYVFASMPSSLGWFAHYVGKTNNLKTRFRDHEHWETAQRHGARHIHAMVVPDEAMRDSIERELIGILQPPINTQLKQSPPLGLLAGLSSGAFQPPSHFGALGLLGSKIQSKGLIDQPHTTNLFREGGLGLLNSPVPVRKNALAGLMQPRSPSGLLAQALMDWKK